MPRVIAVSPLTRPVEIEEEVASFYRHELRELLRGFAGALFVALPLLYTQEMWERARNIEEGVLIAIMLAALLINMGYVSYSGYKKGKGRTHVQWDAMMCFGLGLVASFITLLITARVTLDTPFGILICLLALMSVPTSFGAALAINQLGSRSSGGEKESVAQALLNEDMQKVTATVLGGTLFAFNIVPTIEPKVLLSEMQPTHGLAILVFSLTLSYGIEFTARFHQKQEQAKGVLADQWLSTLFCYLVSLVVAALLLWAFGYLSFDTPPQMALLWVIIVGYATTLGGTAGRLIL